jgi:LETM1 and EF-hand domain-containing protein 1
VCLFIQQIFHFDVRDYDGKVTPEEVASAAMYLKDHLGKEGIQELISNLSKDRG